jgi:hypothetical protein
MSQPFQQSLLRILSALAVVGALLIGGIFLHQWYQIGVSKDLAVIRSYHFGSETIVAHGGAAYESAGAYARASPLAGLAFLPSAVMSVWALVRTSWRCLLLGLALFAVASAGIGVS